MKFPVNEKCFPVIRRIALVFSLLGVSPVALADAVVDYETGAASYRTGDIVGAMAPLKRAADAGHAKSQSMYGTILDSAEMDDEAARYFGLAAEQNDPDGQYGLAKMYLTGEAKAPSEGDIDRLVRAAAAQGHERALITLGLAYISGDPRFGADKPDDPEAGSFVIKAAEIGDVVAISALIDAYKVGRFGLKVDPALSDKWATRLAEIRGQSANTGTRRR